MYSHHGSLLFHMLWFCQFGHQLLSLCTWLMPHLLQYSGTNTEEWWDLDARPCEHSLKVGVEETDETHNSSFFQWSFIHCMQVCNRFVTHVISKRWRAQWNCNDKSGGGVNSKSAWALQHEVLSHDLRCVWYFFADMYHEVRAFQ